MKLDLVILVWLFSILVEAGKGSSYSSIHLLDKGQGREQPRTTSPTARQSRNTATPGTTGSWTGESGSGSERISISTLSSLQEEQQRLFKVQKSTSVSESASASTSDLADFYKNEQVKEAEERYNKFPNSLNPTQTGTVSGSRSRERQIVQKEYGDGFSPSDEPTVVNSHLIHNNNYEFSNYYYNNYLNNNGNTSSKNKSDTPSNERRDERVKRNSKKDKILKIAVLAPALPTHQHALQKIIVPIMLAVQSERIKDILPGWELQVNYKDTDCSSTYGPLAAVDFYTSKTADVFLGPMCDYVIAPVARYAGVWNIPVITPGGQAEAFRHKDAQYPTLTRLAASYSLMGDAFQAILREFDWRHVAFFYHNNPVGSGKGHSFCHFILGTIYTGLKNRPDFRSFDEETPDLKFHPFLNNITSKARSEWGYSGHLIVVLCASPPKVREILMAADDLNMISSGEYVFFNVELITKTNLSYRPWYKENDTEENNSHAKRAFEAVLTVTVPPPPRTPEYITFDHEVKKNAQEKFNFSYGEESVNPFVTAFYDAVLLYAIAVNETLEANGDIANGTEISRRMRGKTFQGITGNVSIDENGDRNADYSLMDMDPETGIFHVVLHYSGKNKEIVKVPGTKIHWAGNRETWPPDTPKCGFDGSGCPTTPRYVIVVALLSATLVVTLISFVFIYRHYKLEAEIASMTWKVNWAEVITKGGGEGRMRRRGSKQSLARASLLSTYSQDSLAPSGNNKQLFVRTAVYKGNIVAVKRIPKEKVELTRSLMLELKHMKDLLHDHLVRFIGASVDQPDLYFLTEYCPRGSLQDILENDQLTLDWTFRYSLMQDVVKAMNYLHSSDIRSHGNLKSSNCVVDSRFVLKVTDFGLHSLRKPDVKEEDTTSYAAWRRKLWTSPEILRMTNAPPEGTQKGDVYSFGIIVHEIAARQGPFYTEEEYTPQEIIKILVGKTDILRPSLQQVTYDDESFIDMLTKCWAEDPNERPDFSQLKQTLRRLNRNNDMGGSSLVDNLLSRMEQYANNLEAVVAERTADYLEEKRKCEEVLYQLLPKTVARTLIAGKQVLAETFDSVTVYFSDIVGFTSLSAESNPMEVVDLLNDLYTCFDSIIENFDVYKVETIGDAYMVVSGLPTRNGIAHAREIARMSLALREAVFKFRIRHRPGDQLKLRIGMHTGPVCAGVVGQKMPRFCLFGDTVNTASRMESNGAPLKIHVSPTTKKALDEFKTFVLELRGEVELKGKGTMSTYWLHGEKRDSAPLPLPCSANSVPGIPPPTSTPPPILSPTNSITTSNRSQLGAESIIMDHHHDDEQMPMMDDDESITKSTTSFQGSQIQQHQNQHQHPPSHARVVHSSSSSSVINNRRYSGGGSSGRRKSSSANNSVNVSLDLDNIDDAHCELIPAS